VPRIGTAGIGADAAMDKSYNIYPNIKPYSCRLSYQRELFFTDSQQEEPRFLLLWLIWASLRLKVETYIRILDQYRVVENLVRLFIQVKSL